MPLLLWADKEKQMHSMKKTFSLPSKVTKRNWQIKAKAWCGGKHVLCGSDQDKQEKEMEYTKQRCFSN